MITHTAGAGIVTRLTFDIGVAPFDRPVPRSALFISLTQAAVAHAEGAHDVFAEPGAKMEGVVLLCVKAVSETEASDAIAITYTPSLTNAFSFSHAASCASSMFDPERSAGHQQRGKSSNIHRSREEDVRL